MGESEKIPILSPNRQLRNDLLATLVQEDPSFREGWAKRVSDKTARKMILNSEKYPTLFSLLNDPYFPFSAKKELIKAGIEKLEIEGFKKEAEKPQTLTSFLRKQDEEKIRKEFNLPYFLDLDLLELLFTKIRIGEIPPEKLTQELAK